MTDHDLCQFGVAGLGVMGAALALNVSDHGFRVAVWNQSHQRTERLLQSHPEKGLVGSETLEQFVASLQRPRSILLMIKAGEPVDELLDRLQPLLSPGDIVIDGGNSWYKDTQRREQRLRAAGMEFVGCGVSGGEKGARLGPSIMPGGSASAWTRLRPVLESVAAHSDSGPCVTHVGPDGAGHFVKMVHNGIEYGDMQILAEAYDLLRKIGGLNAPAISAVFARWNEGVLESFLVELAAVVLRHVDQDSGRPLVDAIVDAAGQKGTGRWTAQTALELGVPIPTITAATEARGISARRSERLRASEILPGPACGATDSERDALVQDLEAAVIASRLCSYAQGMALIRAGSEENGWGISLAEVARIWTGGCIIRARLLQPIRAAFERDKSLSNLLLAPELTNLVSSGHEAWRRTVARAVSCGVPTPAMSSSLAWYDATRSASLPQNLVQAQRDAFGAHTYERIDRPELGFVHTEWLDK